MSGFDLGEKVLLDNETEVTIYARHLSGLNYEVYFNDDIRGKTCSIHISRLTPLKKPEPTKLERLESENATLVELLRKVQNFEMNKELEEEIREVLNASNKE